ncbi:MAG: DUF3971 domain-containing protein [Alphaproteobacteria bacterium]
MFEVGNVVIRPAAKHILEFVAGVMTVLVVGGLVFAIKIASGPTSLRFLAPTIAAVLSEQMGGARVEVKDAIMHWSPTEHAIELRVIGVSFIDRAGNRVAGIPDLDLGLAMTGWKSGVIAPTRIRLDHASAIIERDVNGAFSIGAPSKQAGGDNLFPLVLARLLASNGKGGLGALAELNVKDADITLIDHRTGATIRAPGSRVMFQRLDHGFQCHMNAPAEIAGEHTALTLDGNFDSKAGSGVIIARFTPVGLSGLSGISSFYAPLKPFDVAVGGIAQLSLGANGVISRAQLSLAAEPGKFVPAGSAPPVPVQSASFSGTYWPKGGDVQIENLSFEASGNHAKLMGKAKLKTAQGKGLTITGVDADLSASNVALVWPARFPDPIAIDRAAVKASISFGDAWLANVNSASIAVGQTKIDAAGTIGAGAGSPALGLTANVAGFQVADLAKYWPLTIAPHARLWVTRHVHSGQLTKGVFRIAAPPGALAAETIDDHLWRFDFHIDNGVTEYVFGLPPLAEASADMTLTPHTFALDLRHAKVLSGEITAGHVAIPELGKMGSNIDINVQGHGEVGEILRIIDSPPLKLLARYGLKPEQGSGKAEFDIALTIPEQSNISEQALIYRVSAKGSDVKLTGLVPNVTIDHGALDVQVTQAGLSSTGKFALDGAPMDVVWHEKFHDRSGFSTDFAVKTTLDDEARAGLGFDTGTYVTGPVAVDLKIRGEGKKLRQLSGKLDFTPSAVDLGEYSFSKRSGVPTLVALNVAISEAGAVSVKSASATGKGIAIDGKAELAADGKLISANFPHLKLEGVADASANVSRQNGNGLAVRVSGAFLNIAPILKDALDENDAIGKVPWRVDANLDSVVLRGGVNARNFKATLASTGPHLSVVDVRGQFVKSSGDFSASLIDSPDSQRSLVIASNDAGQLVRGATGIDSVLGGRLALRARLTEGEASLQPSGEPPLTTPISPHKQMAVNGRLKIDEFRVVNAPILAKLLTVGSLQGIGDLLSGEGIQFTHLDVPFWYDKGKFGIEDGRAAGPAIGLTMQGVVDRKQKLTELNGTIVPAYTLNSVLGNVPVLGQLLVSRPGEGIFAFTYNIAGTTSDPQVTVNPLSALAPGFLRRLFQLGESQAGALRLQEEGGQTAQ